MKIALVYPRSTTSTGLSISHGLLQITAELAAAGHEVQIVDFNDPDVSLEYESLRRDDAVGISVTTMQLPHAIEIASALGDALPIVWGGIHCLLDPLSILNRFPQHYVINGEGEIPLLKLLEFLEKKHDIAWLSSQKGICFIHERPYIAQPFFINDLEQMHDIDYRCLPRLERYLKADLYYVLGEHMALSVLTSRGCRWHCAFCVNPLVARHGGHYRSKSFAKIRRETEWIIDEFHLRFAAPVDEDFFLNRELAEQWALYAEEKGFWWRANCRYNYFRKGILDNPNLNRFLKSGLYQIGMSIESGDENIRNNVLEKCVSDSDITNAVSVLEKVTSHPIAVNTSFIVNFPGDTPNSRIKMLKLMDSISRRINVTFSGPQAYRPYPGSKLSENEKRYSIGSIDTYLNEFASDGSTSGTAAGTPLELLNAETYFYTHVARVFFNQRFRFFKLDTESDCRPPLLIAGKRARKMGAKVLLAFFIRILFLPVQLRLKLNFWKFYFEPQIIGSIARFTDKLLWLLRKNKSCWNFSGKSGNVSHQ